MSRFALSADFYEVTMMAGYYSAGMTESATFELYVRNLPPNRSYLVAAGLEQALDYLEALRFDEADIAYLRGVPALQKVEGRFFDEFLPRFRFTGDVWAVAEGTPIFPPEPLLRVTAPMPEAQYVETALLACLAFQTSVASRAARMVGAAKGREVVEFGARRAHGLEAGVLAARAAVLAGCAATSNVEAGRQFGIPVSGTMAHSWVLAFPDEISAFRQYSDVLGSTVMLLDTYDTAQAAAGLVRSGLKPRAVRIDSGDLVALSRTVRGILDEGGLKETTIFASGDLDEWKIGKIVDAGAPIDGFGVGASLVTSSDAPSLGAIYKLVEIQREGTLVPVMKYSTGKRTFPGCKQVWRRMRNDAAVEDVIELADAPAPPSAQPLLSRVMHEGRREAPRIGLRDLRERCLSAIDRLPHAQRGLEEGARFPVRLGSALQATIERLDAMREGAPEQG
jgi:nicotinate phosphoribosyltransferase